MSAHGPFGLIGSVLLVLWLLALVGYALPVKPWLQRAGAITFATGGVVVWGYLGWLWKVLERLPMRTQGETRLWYMAFLVLMGLAIQARWRSRPLVAPAIVMALVFLIITMLHPESLDKTLMPALNSPWFAPHVIVYMMAYAALGTAGAVSAWALIVVKRRGAQEGTALEQMARSLVYVGFPLLTTGFILGAFWAKVAWGHYWSWDPKETWAFLTWAVYLAYLHLDRAKLLSTKLSLWVVFGSFMVLLVCWFGVTILPNAASSVHIYSQ
ncbi:MAG: cytochrome c biogenesis protein [Armatimonadota bacterium]